MPYLRISEVNALGKAARSYQKSATQILTEHARRQPTIARYDVFLSHSHLDADVILGLKTIIEGLGLTVYVDWIDDNDVDAGKVTAKTAERLRVRMRTSACFVYAHSANAADSAWMPWELGYFDGFKPKFVWILPLVVSYDGEYKGQEYLGLYPTIEKLANIPGRLGLGFTGVRNQNGTIPLAHAASSSGGVFLKTS